MFKKRRDAEDVLRRAMGQLYMNDTARNFLRQRLAGRNIETMSDEEIYTLVRDVVRDLQRNNLAMA